MGARGVPLGVSSFCREGQRCVQIAVELRRGIVVSDRQVIHVSGSDVGSREYEAIGRVFSNGYLGMGEETVLFEKELEDFFGRSVACVSTGTAALHLALQACGIGPSDEVIVPTLTYVATFQAISATGATPVACDVSADGLLLDPDDVATRITERTRAIVPVHFASAYANLDSIRDLVMKNGLRVIEDAAHAFGTETPNGRVGSFGDIACFSFDPIKNITSGEGGCVVSNDGEVLNRVRDSRLLGVVGDSGARAKQTRLYNFDVERQGWRYHMSNLCGAIGRTQLARFPEIAAQRRSLAQEYERLLKTARAVQLLPIDFRAAVPHIFVVRLANRQTRDLVREILANEFRINTAIHYQPNHLLSLYRDPYLRLPTAEREADRIMSLPLHSKLSLEDVAYVCDSLVQILDKDPRIECRSN